MIDIAALAGDSLERAPWGWVLMVAALTALIKAWPILQLQAFNARAAMRGEKRDDLDDCKARLDAMDAKLLAQGAHIHNLDMRLFGTVAAYRILHDDTKLHRPDSAALHQATTMFKTTWDGPVEALGELVR